MQPTNLILIPSVLEGLEKSPSISAYGYFDATGRLAHKPSQKTTAAIANCAPVLLKLFGTIGKTLGGDLLQRAEFEFEEETTPGESMTTDRILFRIYPTVYWPDDAGSLLVSITYADASFDATHNELDNLEYQAQLGLSQNAAKPSKSTEPDRVGRGGVKGNGDTPYDIIVSMLKRLFGIS
jgi:hypothetical protein